MKYFALITILFYSIYCFPQQNEDDVVIYEVEEVEQPEEIVEVPFAIVEKVPVYRGCNNYSDNLELKKCMSSKISEFVSKKFNQKIVKELNIPSGTNVRIIVVFKIGKDGRIIKIHARSSHNELEKEAIRVIKKIPRLKKPGYQRGKPVIVPYALPIIFTVE